MAFIDGPWDMDDDDEIPSFVASTQAEEAPASPTPPHVEPDPAPVLPKKTAYTTVRVKFSAPATPGSTVSTGYDMSCALEDFLKEKFGEWLGMDARYEVYVQVDIR